MHIHMTPVDSLETLVEPQTPVETPQPPMGGDGTIRARRIPLETVDSLKKLLNDHLKNLGYSKLCVQKPSWFDQLLGKDSWT